MGKRQDAAWETRRRLMDAARELLKEKTAECINIEDITRKAGVAKGSFYTHFKRKEDLVSEIAMEEYSILSERVSHHTADVYDQLYMYLNESVALIEKHTLQIAQQWMKSVVSPLPEEQSGTKKYGFDVQNIADILSAAVETGTLRGDTPAQVLAGVIVNAYYGMVAAWCISRGSEGQLKDSMEQFCSLALKPVIDGYREVGI